MSQNMTMIARKAMSQYMTMILRMGNELESDKQTMERDSHNVQNCNKKVVSFEMKDKNSLQPLIKT